MSTIDTRTLFSDARTHFVWQDRPLTDEVLEKIYDLTKMGPTSANSQPMRIVFVRSTEAKAKLKPTLMPGNVDKTMSAPVTAIVAYDSEFYNHLPRLMPPMAAYKDVLAGLPEPVRDRMAFQSAMMQAGYLVIAARALGVDAGPMGGFNAPAVDAAFFAGSTWKAALLVNLGYGDISKVFPRQPRLAFAEATRIE